eukprot:CAMPEP_0204861554 /NCGR_PEP_ID=MMETSP1348-20121228/1702_1 /ASSEMBLY_ACC=CAM_ASM_000700 /TAXON_ID=215587 /ORGANISM="Aplanochytrium stocchinoi, Strain GSBS06" /LENGTH=204 /DNA_ID=CAMNT_0052011017 /DNA_START=216 /DNA_END=830 /DNA_ORIENTATION=-
MKPPQSNSSTPGPPPYQTQSANRTPSTDSDAGESLALPPVPTEFEELEEMSLEEMKKLQNDQDAFENFFKSLDLVKNPIEIRDEMHGNNIEQARKNLSYEDKLIKAKMDVDELKQEARNRREAFEVLAKRQAKALERFQPVKLLAKLDEKADEADMASEDVSSSFLSGEIDVNSFLKRYMELRKLYHLRHSKAVQFRKGNMQRA